MLDRRSLLAVPALLPGVALAQPTWPSRAMRFIVPFAPGGFVDVLARVVAARLSTTLGQPVVVENRPGAGGNIGADLVAKAAPDGYTWLATPSGPLVVNQFLFASMPYDPRTAFAATSLLANTPKVIVVARARPWQSLSELLAAAQAQPDSVRAGSAGNGSSLHIALELLKQQSGTQILHIPYRGAAPAVTDLVSGQIDMLVDNLPNILPQIREGHVRALAVATPARLPQLPNVPTTAEAGLPGFIFGTWFGLVAPARTPPEIVARMSAAVDSALREPEVGGRLAEQGAVLGGGTPEAFAGFIAAQTTALEAVIRGANIRAE
jgi:tripartite-type tricarboxylate transporter receptor subunit TctC